MDEKSQKPEEALITILFYILQSCIVPCNGNMIKVVIIGPESTGKSTLCEQLATHYGTNWCPEYARQYLEAQGTSYNYNDLLHIARGQIALEENHSRSGNKLLFIDTDMYVMKVWCEFVFGKCHRFVLDQIVERQYDLYLLCATDLPWADDPLREYPDLKTREKLFHFYKDILVNQQTPWTIINGGYEERLRKAVAAVDAIILKK